MQIFVILYFMPYFLITLALRFLFKIKGFKLYISSVLFCLLLIFLPSEYFNPSEDYFYDIQFVSITSIVNVAGLQILEFLYRKVRSK